MDSNNNSFIILYLQYLKSNTYPQLIQLNEIGLSALDCWVNTNNKIIDDDND